MNDEQFDKELSELYQQRKAEIVAPKINLIEPTKRKNYSLAKLFSIFTVGGIASFGILAIITNLAKKPAGSNIVITPKHQVSLADQKARETDDTVMIEKVTLPPKPEPPTLLPELDVLIPEKNNARVNVIENITLNTKQIISVPHLKDPEFLLKPVFKVMPKFPSKSLKEQESGFIRLRYEIDTSGKVINIEIIEREVSRELQRSAINALAKWRYQEATEQKINHEIIFEFNPEK